MSDAGVVLLHEELKVRHVEERLAGIRWTDVDAGVAPAIVELVRG